MYDLVDLANLFIDTLQTLTGALKVKTWRVEGGSVAAGNILNKHSMSFYKHFEITERNSTVLLSIHIQFGCEWLMYVNHVTKHAVWLVITVIITITGSVVKYKLSTDWQYKENLMLFVLHASSQQDVHLIAYNKTRPL